MMELDPPIIPGGCSPGERVTVQGPECLHVFCTDPPTNPKESEDVDSVSKQECPKPPGSSEQEAEERCFSLATALKELHKLLVLSGRGSARAGDEDEADPADVTQGNHLGSSRNGEPDSDCHLGDGMGGTDETSVCSEEDAPAGSFQESPAADQPLPGIVLNHDATCDPGDPSAGTEHLQGLSGEPGGPDCEWGAPVQPPDAPSAIERIVAAGFTAQDALVALEGSGGDVELALLALLARNIVVPT